MAFSFKFSSKTDNPFCDRKQEPKRRIYAKTLVTNMNIRPASINTASGTTTVPTAATVSDMTNAAIKNNLASTSRIANKSYVSEWNRYKQWVTEKRTAGLVPMGCKYIETMSIDLYFQEDVVQRKITAPSARRVLSALQWYSNNFEHVLPKLNLESDTVKVALDVHNYKQSELRNKSFKDPHSDLPTDVLTQAECSKLIKVALGMEGWRPLCTTFTACCNTYMRMDSYLKLYMSDLLLDRTHGPKEDDGSSNMDSYALGYILQARTHKDNSFDKRVTGNWRHREYLRCATGMLAFNLFTRLYNDKNIHFLRSENPHKPPDWHLIPLLDSWDNQKAADKAYRRLYSLSGIRWGKVTHIRKQGMEFASSRGELTSHAVSGLSKHDIGKVARYITELPPSTLRVMSGFKFDEDYFVPRTQLAMFNGLSKEDITLLVFPMINEWREQVGTMDGDHGLAAQNFLYHVLPYLAAVVVQDGIYWIRDFPEHEATRLLRFVMGAGYDVWARDSRALCDQMLNLRNRARVGDLNLAAQAAFEDLSRGLTCVNGKLDCAKDEIMSKVEELHQHSLEVNRNLTSILTNQQRIFDEMKLVKRLVVQSSTQKVQTCNQNVTMLSTVGFGGTNEENNVLDETTSFDDVEPLSIPERLSEENHPKQKCAFSVLHRTPRVPSFPDSLPKSLHDVLKQYQTFDLKSFRGCKKTDWPKKRRVAYSRRCFLHDAIAEKARTFVDRADFNAVKMPRAALALDEGRLLMNMSVDKYRQYLVAIKTKNK